MDQSDRSFKRYKGHKDRNGLGRGHRIKAENEFNHLKVL